MEKKIDDIWERLHGIALGTSNISGEINKLTNSINENNIQSSKLTKVGHYLTGAIIFLGLVQLIIPNLPYILTIFK